MAESPLGLVERRDEKRSVANEALMQMPCRPRLNNLVAVFTARAVPQAARLHLELSRQIDPM